MTQTDMQHFPAEKYYTYTLRALSNRVLFAKKVTQCARPHIEVTKSASMSEAAVESLPQQDKGAARPHQLICENVNHTR